MKKCLSILLSLWAILGYTGDGWVLLQKQQVTGQTQIVFTDLLTEAFDDYIIVIDMMEPYGGYSDVVLQVSTDNGGSWLSVYTGGISTARSRAKNLTSTASTPMGVPVTNKDDYSYYFMGELRLSNVNGTGPGPKAVMGSGFMGNDGFGRIFGTFPTAIDPINAIRFVAKKPVPEPRINRADVTIYGLRQSEP